MIIAPKIKFERMIGMTTNQSNSPESHIERMFANTFCGVLWAVTVVLCVYVGFRILATYQHQTVNLQGDGIGPFVAIVVAIFGILITGIFVFTTFRIDRGARLEAASIAHETASTIAESQANTTATNVAAKIARDRAKTVAENQARKTAERVAKDSAQVRATEVAIDTAKSHATDQAKDTARKVAEDMLKQMEQRIAYGISIGVQQAIGQQK